MGHTAAHTRLLKHDLLQQFRTDDFAYLLALFCDLLRLLFATHDLVTHRLAFCGQAVHGSVILVLDRKSKVPILRAAVCFLEEDLVIRRSLPYVFPPRVMVWWP